jgi:hypothetical protein
MLELRITSSNFAGRTFPLSPERRYVLGRSRTCDITIRDPALSRQHVALHVLADGVRLTDLGSSNGCKVNDSAVREAVLRSGDRVQIGATVFEVAESRRPGAMSTHGLTQSRQTDLLRRMPACAACGVLVPETEIRAGRARTAGDATFCARCADPHLGLLIGGFRILAPLGEGAMGAVYRAAQVSLQRLVALKLLLRCFTADESAVQRFLREARVGSRCDHPGIVQVIDAGCQDGLYYLALEFVDGGNLADRLAAATRLPAAEVVRIGRQVCAAMAHAHARGVVHRDLKPGNLLQTKSGDVKVTDLGLAKSFEESGLSSLTQAGTTMGTLTYMPPEQLDDARAADARADVYALGATLFHLLTGNRPYPARTPREYAEQIKTFPVHWPPAALVTPPGPLRAALERAMAKAPADRFATMEQFGGALE